MRKIEDDLPDEFRRGKRTLAICRAIDRQIEEARAAVKSIKTDTSLETAVGAQLDMIGDILNLTRTEAAVMQGDTIYFDVLSDDDYRLYLKYKSIEITGDGTYDTLMRSIQAVLGDDVSISYAEGSAPATIILNVETSEDEEVYLQALPPMKAAGVTLEFALTYSGTIAISHEEYKVGKSAYNECGVWQCGAFPLSKI